LYVTYRLGLDSTTWLGPTLLKNTASVADADTKQNSVLVQGRFVYVFVEGEEPLLFYYDTGSAGIEVTTDTGPGEQPILDAFVQTISVESGQTPQTTTPANLAESEDVLPGIAAPPSTEPAKARVYPVAFYGDVLTTRWLAGPSDMSLWTVPPAEMVDPTFDSSGQVWLGGLGGLSGNSVATSRPPSYYSFAYQLYNSVTGRTSQLSQLANIAVGNLDTGPLAINAQGELVAWALMELVYDSAKYDSVYFYRSVQAENNTILHQDALITLADYESSDQSGMTGDFKRAYYFYQLTDPVLVSQPTFQGDILYEANMPEAGAAVLYDGCALYGKIGGFDTETAGLGFIRWSNTYDVSPEQVAPSNEYPLSSPTEDVIHFAKVGPNVIAYSTTGLYHIRKEGFIIKATPLQAGYGSPSNRGACVVGSECYLIAESGVKLIGTMGDIANVEVMDDLVQTTWAGEVSSVQLAYDATSEVVWIFNPVRETAGLLWLRTSEFTELRDLNFEHVREGKIPTAWATNNRAMQPRAVFVQKVLPDGDAGDPSWRVFVTDYGRAKTQRHLLDINNTSGLIFTLASEAMTNTLIGPTSFFNKPTGRLEGAKVYALDGVRAGLSGTIKRVIASNLLEMEDDMMVGTPAGTRMGLSPVYFQWTGHGCGIISEQQEFDGTPVSPYDYSRVRSVEAIGCVFTDVSGGATSLDMSDERFSADIYLGNSLTPVNGDAFYRTFPLAANGDDVTSIVDGPGIYWARANDAQAEGGITGASLFPTVRIFVPDLDYTLLNVLVRGSQRTAITESFAATE
jgi:hypothetical protein